MGGEYMSFGGYMITHSRKLCRKGYDIKSKEEWKKTKIKTNIWKIKY